MAKNIVFSADGTWDGPVNPGAGMNADGNYIGDVLKLLQNFAGSYSSADIALKDEQEKVLMSGDGASFLQTAKYIHGVGDSSNELVQCLGGGLVDQQGEN